MNASPRCAIVQSFRTNAIPDWILRCMSSVQAWARSRGYDYKLWGDEIRDVCGTDYLASGFRNWQAITNLARLLITRKYLREDVYDAVVWLDADVFVFDPGRFAIDHPLGTFELGYAFGREVWVHENRYLEGPMAHNAFTYFSRDAKDLDLLIEIMTHIGRRPLRHNFQVGVQLLRGLQFPLGFQILPHVAVFSPALIVAIQNQDAPLLQSYGRAFSEQSQAGNLGLSIAQNVGEGTLMRVMDILEATAGAVVNQWSNALP